MYEHLADTKENINDSTILNEIDERLRGIELKSKIANFDNEKWMKICKITKNILLANIKQNLTNFNSLHSNIHPYIISNDISSNATTTINLPSINLWEHNILEFIALSSFKSDQCHLNFKVIDSTKPSEHTHKHKTSVIVGNNKFTSHTKLFSGTVAPNIPPRGLMPDKGERKGGKVLEKFNLKPNKSPTWDAPSSYSNGIFTLGNIKDGSNNVAVDNNRIEHDSAATALKNLSYLVQDFQVVTKKSNGFLHNDDPNNIKIKDIDNFAFIDEDVVDDSLKCSQFSKFFKVLKDQNTAI